MAWREDAHINKLRVGPTGLIQNVLSEKIEVSSKTLKISDNGKTFILYLGVGGQVYLPEPENGLNFKFIVGLVFAAIDWKIVTNSSAAIIQGSLIVAGAAVVASNEKQINFINTAESLGDYVDVYCDGTSWFVSGVGALSGSITVTAP